MAKTQYLHQKMWARRYVIKEIRANLMLEWLANYTGGRIVYLIRHPCAVIGSRMRQDEPAWVPDIEEILCQDPLMADFLEPVRRAICRGITPVQRLAILWCVENVVPLCQARSNDWLLCCYEEFLHDRDAAFARVFQSLGIEPSLKTLWAKTVPVSNPTHNLNMSRSWHAPLTDAEGEDVLRICEEFGLRLYGRQTMPLGTPHELVDSVCARGPSKGEAKTYVISSEPEGWKPNGC